MYKNNKPKNKSKNKPKPFVSVVKADKRMFGDFAKISHRSNNFFNFFFLAAFICFSIANIATKNGNNLFGFAAIIWILAISYWALTIFTTSLNYKRTKASSGGKEVTNTITFSDKIYVESTSGAKLQYEYNQVKAIFETKKHYFLKLNHNLYLISSKEVNKDGDFVEFLFSKCENIKKKRIRSVNNAKMFSLTYICILTVLFFATAYVHFF